MEKFQPGQVITSKSYNDGKSNITIESLREDGDKTYYYGTADGGTGVIRVEASEASLAKDQPQTDSDDGEGDDVSHAMGSGAGSESDSRSPEEIKKAQEEAKVALDEKASQGAKPVAKGSQQQRRV